MYKFIKVENKIIGKNGLLKEVEDTNIQTYLVPVYLHISCKTDRLGELDTNIEKIVEWCGLKPNRNKGKSNDNIKEVLSYLKEKEVIDFDVDIDTIKPKELFTIKYEEVEESFGMAYVEHIKKIMNIQDKKIERAKLLTYYCFLAVSMYRNNNSHITGGRYNVCYWSVEKTSEFTHLHKDTITKYNKLLVEMDIIRIARPIFEVNGKTYRGNNIYTFYWNYYKDKELGISIWYDNLQGHIHLAFKQFIAEKFGVSKEDVKIKRNIQSMLLYTGYYKEVKGKVTEIDDVKEDYREVLEDDIETSNDEYINDYKILTNLKSYQQNYFKNLRM